MSRLKSRSSSKSDRAIEDGHLAETGAGFEDGERFLSRPGDGARDPDLALRNEEQAVAGLAFLEDVLPEGELLLAHDLRDARQLAFVEVLEDRGLLEQIEIHAVKLRRTPGRGK